jgi:hypothetical protein
MSFRYCARFTVGQAQVAVVFDVVVCTSQVSTIDISSSFKCASGGGDNVDGPSSDVGGGVSAGTVDHQMSDTPHTTDDGINASLSHAEKPRKPHFAGAAALPPGPAPNVANWEERLGWDLNRTKVPTKAGDKFKRAAEHCARAVVATARCKSVLLHEPGFFYALPAIMAALGPDVVVHCCAGGDRVQVTRCVPACCCSNTLDIALAASLSRV